MRGEEGENNSGPGFLRPSCPSYIVLMRELGVMPIRLEIIKLAARHWRRSKLSLRSRMAILNIAIIDIAPHGVVFVGLKRIVPARACIFHYVLYHSTTQQPSLDSLPLSTLISDSFPRA